jgi:hypothetical protein
MAALWVLDEYHRLTVAIDTTETALRKLRELRAALRARREPLMSDDLRTLAQAYLDAREVDAVSGDLTASREVTRTGLALGAALGTPSTVPPAAHAAAILAALDAADAQGYARAMAKRD